MATQPRTAAELEASARIPLSDQVIEMPSQPIAPPHETPGENDAIRAGG